MGQKPSRVLVADEAALGVPRPNLTGAWGRPSARPLSNWHRDERLSLTPGERAADWLRNGMGSWTFVGLFGVVMLVWAAINVVSDGWDPYPFILLNLFLSMLAGLQGAILLIAAKRQDAIAAALAQHDFETNLAAKREIEELMEINRIQLEILTELRAEAKNAQT